MEFKVIDISTSTQTYIANNVLTHNKVDCSSVYAADRLVSHQYTITFGNNYSPVYPISVRASVYGTNVIDPGGGCKSVSLPTNTNTAANASQLTGLFYYNEQYYNTNGVIGYTGSVWARDAAGKLSSGSTSYYSGGTGTSKFTRLITNCLTPDTLISKFDGNDIILNDIKIGDELLTIDLKTMEYEKSIVTHKRESVVNKLFIINDSLLKCTDSHKHIIKKNGVWIEQTTDNLIIGDILLTKDFNEILINKIVILN
jgi:hypothetical protein